MAISVDVVNKHLINCARPETVLNNLLNFLNEEAVKEFIEAKNWLALARYLKIKQGLGWELIGLVWSILRELFSQDELLESIGYIPAGFYAYCNIEGNLVDLRGLSISRIGDNAFFKSNLSKIYLPSTIQQVGMRAFASLDSYYLSIYFEGTKKEWRSIKKHSTIFKDNFTEDISRTVYCSDGDLVYRAKKIL